MAIQAIMHCDAKSGEWVNVYTGEAATTVVDTYTGKISPRTFAAIAHQDLKDGDFVEVFFKRTLRVRKTKEVKT